MDDSSIEITLKVEPLYGRKTPQLDLNVWKQVEPKAEKEPESVKRRSTRPKKSKKSLAKEKEKSKPLNIQQTTSEGPITNSVVLQGFESGVKEDISKVGSKGKPNPPEVNKRQTRKKTSRSRQNSKSDNLDTHISYESDAVEPGFFINVPFEDKGELEGPKDWKFEAPVVGSRPYDGISPDLSNDETLVSFAEVDSRPPSLVKRQSKKTQATDHVLHGSNQEMINEFTRQAMLHQIKTDFRFNYEMASWLVLFVIIVVLLLYRTERIAETCQNANLAN